MSRLPGLQKSTLRAVGPCPGCGRDLAKLKVRRLKGVTACSDCVKHARALMRGRS